MGTAIIAAAAGAVSALLLVALVAGLRRRNRTRADLEAMLEAAQRESDDLRARLESLTARIATGGPGVVEVPEEAATYLITDAGQTRSAVIEDPVEVPDRVVLSATLGAPLVKVAAFSHGVRRALAPETRNRIWFEMRKQTRVARKRRRKAVRDHLRQVRAEERSQETLA